MEGGIEALHHLHANPRSLPHEGNAQITEETSWLSLLFTEAQERDITSGQQAQDSHLQSLVEAQE